MAITEYKTGSASISTTEYSLVTPGTTLASDTTDGVYQVFIDFALMVAGDEYKIDIYEKVTGSSGKVVIYSSRLEGKQTSPFVTPSLVLMHGWDVTVTLITGSAKTVGWSIRQVA